MPSRSAFAWLVLPALVTSACALAGYDFDDYQRGAADEPTATTYSSGGAADEPTATTYSSGGASNVSSEAGQSGAGGACEPRGCSLLPASCGVIDDGCGAPLDCGQCLWWFEECRHQLCEIVE
jgi:hypothetical protein